ncbi:hypothetical protein U5640_05335 [Streptomyces sp. SS7]|uniref:hypothetical protein n=1 Tax=Streptomyces sp. SS7 TaxID=3108485 RepID=UPI0030EB9CCB
MEDTRRPPAPPAQDRGLLLARIAAAREALDALEREVAEATSTTPPRSDRGDRSAVGRTG